MYKRDRVDDDPNTEPIQLSWLGEPASEPKPADTGLDDIASLFSLAKIPGMGFVSVRTLFEAYHGHLSMVWNAGDDELHQHLRLARTPRIDDVMTVLRRQAKTAIKWGREQLTFLQRRNISLVFRQSRSFPQRLLDLPDPPAWLFVEGDVELLDDPAIVAVVGTRKPTGNGIEAARHLSSNLARGRSLILSGLAEGIDEVGHQTAVDFDIPTIAVLGHGIEVFFPSSTTGLRRQVIERGGAVISEYLPRDTYSAERFVQRNRLQAALATLVAIVEGRTRSGTAHTVRFARQLKRPLFGVRLGPPSKDIQQELLEDLERAGDPVFDLAESEGLDRLNSFLSQYVTREMRSHRLSKPKPRLFNGLLAEVDRLIHDYHVTENDIDWLIKELHLRRNNLGEGDDHVD